MLKQKLLSILHAGITSHVSKTPVKTVDTPGYTSHFKTEERLKAQEGYRADLDKNFRSKMEANCYRYFTQCHPYLKLCEFEPHLFTERDGLPRGFNYLPDFRITDYKGNVAYVEVKGVWDERSKRAIRVMRKYRPDIELLIIDSKMYQEIKRRFAKKIKGWE